LSPLIVLGLPHAHPPYLGSSVPSGALPSCLFLRWRYRAGYDKYDFPHPQE